MVYQLIAHYLVIDCIPCPSGGIAQGWIALFGREVLLYFWQKDRQVLLLNYLWQTVLVIDRKRLTPIALTREDRIAQAVVYLSLTGSLSF